MQQTRALRSTRIPLPVTFLLIAALLVVGACSPGVPSADEPVAPASPGDADLPLAEGEAGQDPESTEALQAALSAPLSGVDPCALLTTAEVEAAFGEPMGSAERETIYSYESCNFHNQRGGKSIVLQLTQQSPELFTRDNVETAAIFEVELIPISGLGDDAAYYSGLLRVRVGDSVFQLATWHPEAEQDQALEMMQSLARLVLERYP